MGKGGDKYQKTKFSREKTFAYSEEDIVKNDAKLNAVKDVRKKEREENIKKAKLEEKEEDNDNNDK